MNIDRIREILNSGESLTVEFKQSKNKLNKDVFETVCAFLNRNGGHLFLGVEDDGEIVGINPDADRKKLKKEFVTYMNNPRIRLSPTAYISIEEVEIDGKVILYYLFLKVLRYIDVMEKYMIEMKMAILISLKIQI